MRVRTAAVAAIVLVAALAVAGLAPASSRHRAEKRARALRVDIRGLAFHPPTLRVRRGTRVVFANRDRIAHTATRRGSFNTGRIAPGRSVAVRFKRPGVYRYVCAIHSFMHGKIVVR
jgi:plastocyanin